MREQVDTGRRRWACVPALPSAAGSAHTTKQKPNPKRRSIWGSVMPSRAKYRRMTELYTDGAVELLDDGNPIFLRVLNPYERQEALHDAQSARARLVMALTRFDSDEEVKARSSFATDGRDKAIDQLIDLKGSELMVDALNALRDDPDWKERIDILDRSEDLAARPHEDTERQLLDAVEVEYLNEISTRSDAARAQERARLAELSDEGLLAEYMNAWRSMRGGEVADAEFRLTELWYAARCCDGAERGDGVWDHGGCEGHRMRLFDAKADIAGLPTRLQEQLMAALGRLNMSVREAKNSARASNLSASSPQPSAQEESTPSTPIEIPENVPGTSPPPSSTP
jgi:hypothetical protein